MRDFWQAELAAAGRMRPRVRVLAGFNVNVDRVVHLDPGCWQALLASRPEATPERVERGAEHPPAEADEPLQLLALLWNRLSQGRSHHMTVEAPDLLAWLEGRLAAGEARVGGQAGIIANQAAALDLESLLVTPALSPPQAGHLRKTVRAPSLRAGRLAWLPVAEAADPSAPTKVNWILEYDRGQVFHLDGRQVRVPRSNRVIVASRPRGLVMAFPPELEPHLDELGASVDVAFLAGYHYAAPVLPDGRSFDEYLSDSIRHVRLLKRRNPTLVVHVEYVLMKHVNLEIPLLAALGPAAGSFGINENELRGVLERSGEPLLAAELRSDERPYLLYRGARVLLERYAFQRVQVHNLGYYCLVERLSTQESGNPAWARRRLEAMRRGGLFGTAVTQHRARFGTEAGPDDVTREASTPLSDLGLEAVRAFEAEIIAREAVQPLAPGGFRLDDLLVQVVPAHVQDRPVLTVGMGDTISSTSLIAERWLLGLEGRPLEPIPQPS
ncbi:ADP-dependent glucokinase/phosphofructokinase [Limnochorda pilosa]|uniref:Phosphofructokinase n=1 Tax=Limnochorda pilosa TaxID=1555112 RepID=A0A0K2SJ05_LIMPI|nr:ADP-dependent glucokinase/phosphofructokinase [Limnochorda pilosa]BAS27106.1 phosphofructokinase [Limnochorda pilosa]